MTAPDMSLDELMEIGVPRWLMDIAQDHGVYVAVDVWRKLSSVARSGETDRSRLYVPAWSVYMRYQRNRYIRSLAAEGAPPEKIVKMVRSELCERISLCHVQRIVRG